jgi:hypothetical protein
MDSRLRGNDGIKQKFRCSDNIWIYRAEMPISHIPASLFKFPQVARVVSPNSLALETDSMTIPAEPSLIPLEFPSVTFPVLGMNAEAAWTGPAWSAWGSNVCPYFSYTSIIMNRKSPTCLRKR